MKIDGHEERQAFVASQVKQKQKVLDDRSSPVRFFLSRYFFTQFFCSNEGWIRGRLLSADNFVKKNMDNVCRLCYCNTA